MTSTQSDPTTYKVRPTLPCLELFERWQPLTPGTVQPHDAPHQGPQGLDPILRECSRHGGERTTNFLLFRCLLYRVWLTFLFAQMFREGPG